MTDADLLAVVDTWLATPYSGDERHTRRLLKIEALCYDDVAPIRAVDAEIAGEATRSGARVVQRPADLSGDEATSETALLHALDVLREKEDIDPHLVVFLQATSPLTTGHDIDAAVKLLESGGADSLLSVSPLRGFVWRAGNDGLKPLNYDYQRRPRRQDAPEDVVENGALYVFRPWVLREQGNRLGGRIVSYRMPPSSYF